MINRLFDKLCQIKLKVNVEKTKAMIITNKSIDRSIVNIFMNGSKLSIEYEIKYLGVIIDENLKFDKKFRLCMQKSRQKGRCLKQTEK